MPRLIDVRKVIKTTIPSIEGSEVELFDSFLAGELEDLMEVEVKNDFQRGLVLLSKMIKSWNLTDENDKPLPITVENLRKIDGFDIEELLSKTSVVKRAVKKMEGNQISKESREKKV